MSANRSVSAERVGDRAGEPERAREVRTLERRFRSIVERTVDGILVVDRDGVVRFANAAATRMFGRPRDELVGSPFGYPLVEGERTEIELVRADQRPADGSDGGGGLVVELRATDTEWEGEPASIVSLRDITDRKKAEEQERRLLREQVARAQAEEAAERSAFLSEASRRLFSSLETETTLQTVVSLAADGFADFCVLDVRDGASTRRFTATGDRGPRAELLRATEAYPLDPDADSPQARVYRDREPVLVADVTEEWLRSATRDEHHLELARGLGVRSIVLVPLCASERCVGVFTAVRWRETPFTERDLQTAAELGRRAALAIENARLYQAAEAGNVAKTNFLSVMSHELRTPLSAVIGYTDLLERGVAGEPTDRQKEFLNRIRASSNHLLQIIEEILSFANTEAGVEQVNATEFTLRELMDGVEALAGPLGADREVALVIECADEEAVLRTDARKVRQILLNLISNAFKFTDQGEIRVSARAEGEDAVFVVEDTGIGIPEDRLERIFERFWQAEDPMTRRAGGTGLGLAVARAFARLLGGDISVESVPGDGSAFTARLRRVYEDG